MYSHLFATCYANRQQIILEHIFHTFNAKAQVFVQTFTFMGHYHLIHDTANKAHAGI